MLSSIIRGLFGRCLAPSWRRLGLNPLWGAGETAILSSCVVPANQIEYAVSEAQEKPSVSFIGSCFIWYGIYHAFVLLFETARRIYSGCFAVAAAL